MKRLAKFGLGLGALGLAYDYHTKEQIVCRNLRTLRCGINILYQYKIRFDAENADEIHDSVAKTIYETCYVNDGLYVKFGQGIASFDHILPPPYCSWLGLLQDKAKYIHFDEVKRVLLEELKQPIEDVFEYIDEYPIASASLAQVHKGKLKTGEIVAIKVQKPNIQPQFRADMMMHWLVNFVLEYAFDLPLLQFCEIIESNLEKEIDFNIERQNSEQARLSFEKCGTKNVYIPQNYLSTKRLLVSEWIDGIKITHLEKMEKEGLNPQKVLKTVIDCFAEQIFVSGFVHCDPHPGNIFVRKVNNKHQVVLIDFGLCIKLPNDFRKQYALFWQSLFLQDTDKMKSIVKEWGIGDEELFASMQLMRPYNKHKPIQDHIVTKDEVLKMQLKMKEDIRKLMKEVHLFPKQLIFVNRNMNLVRSINKKCGSLVNRINIMARSASLGTKIEKDLFDDQSNFGLFIPKQGFINGFWFETRLMIHSILYRIITLWMKVRGQRGYEDFIDQKQKEAMKTMYGQYGFKQPDETTFNA